MFNVKTLHLTEDEYEFLLDLLLNKAYPELSTRIPVDYNGVTLETLYQTVKEQENL